ncbi:type VI secretion system tip protein VgrG [Pseudomonas sp. SWRI153]|uniref:Type VI secretion system tip protein VgrG n=1 Tax=Pseudomonas khorasanensis TaxID=2745508 RepID=A0A923JIR9_9PSED|nr:type VI secretion system tip protein TssI/VgrG [Pseudomonas khorasanensis]MBV4487647.1 type VI secretion system tip protein VgrG [Pseudomonas khorasanensis]
MLNDKESPYTLTLTDSGLRLPVVRFRGEEALNQPYRFDIEMMGLAPAIAPGSLLHRPAFLRLGEQHGFHGIISSASCEHRGTHRIGYRVVLVPHLQQLAQASKRRVFTHLSAPQLIQQLLEENGLPVGSYRIEMTVGHYPARAFCIQYEESDLALVQRLCEEEGIHYHFEHGPDGHVVVFADDSLSLPQVPMEIPFSADEQPPSPCVSVLYQQHRAAPAPVLHAIRNRGQQALDDEAANEVSTELKMPAQSQERLHAEQRSRRHLQRQRCQLRSIHGRSDCSDLLSGRLLLVAGHPIHHFNEQWLISAVRHQGQHPSILDPAATVHRYDNDFTAHPWSSDFRPPLKQPRPDVAGYHLARVAGAHGESAQVDESGRLAVILWPTGNQQGSDCDALWLPIAMSRLNGPIAADTLPRAGSEVWVSFLDSDPDRPILCLDHSHQQPARNPEPARDNLLLDWLINRAGH